LDYTKFQILIMGIFKFGLTTLKNELMLFSTDLAYGVIIIVIGFSIETIGWRIHRAMIGISGFVTGGVIANFLATNLLNLSDLTWMLALLSILSVATAIAFLVYEKISVGITSGLVGAMIVSGFTSTRTLIGWRMNFPLIEPHYNYPVVSIAFLISTYIGWRYFKLGYIILSTGIGSILVASGGILAGLWNYDNLGIFVLLSLMIGAIVQLSQEGTRREQILRVNEYKFCPYCGEMLAKGSYICSRCGNSIDPRTKNSHKQTNKTS